MDDVNYEDSINSTFDVKRVDAFKKDAVCDSSFVKLCLFLLEQILLIAEMPEGCQ